MVSLIVFEGHSSKTLIELEKRVRDVRGYTSISDGMPDMAHSHGVRWLLDATWGLQSSHGYGLLEVKMPPEKIRWIRSLRGAECEDGEHNLHV